MAVVLASMLVAWRDAPRRGGAVLLAVACVVGIGLYLAFYKAVAPSMVATGARAPALQGMHGNGLFAQAGHAWQWVMVPLSSAFVHRSTLQAWFPGIGGIATILLGSACVVAHFWFWKKALTCAFNRTAFMAVAIMLLFYGLVAGILIGRVSQFGSEYLWQPRYGFIYRWHVIALLMMLVAQWPAMAPAGGRGMRWMRRVAVAIVALVMALQLPLDVTAWKNARYVRHANAEIARQLLAMGGDASRRAPAACAAQLVVCRYDDARRQRIVGFLEQQRLNAFSPEVRARNGYPGD
jgi:hypothetical protein